MVGVDQRQICEVRALAAAQQLREVIRSRRPSHQTFGVDAIQVLLGPMHKPAGPQVPRGVWLLTVVGGDGRLLKIWLL
jgi:hypothetical protein